MENKRELILTAQKLGIETVDMTKSELQEAIDIKHDFVAAANPPEESEAPPEPEPETESEAPADTVTSSIDMPAASEGMTTSDVAAKTESKLKATTRPSDIVKMRRQKNKDSGYPKHLPHNVMQPGPHGLSTGG